MQGGGNSSWRRGGSFPWRATPRYAIALGCEVSYAKDFVYADGLDLTSKGTFDPIGISCRICERTNCPQRAIPPLKSRLRIDRDRRDILPYQLPG
ncbi:DUF2083 domain-containing protein [Bradyrhizobium elkanii USDA 76]|nr:DUF2083 domain-containing protein [Bradyrhizobium elkanii USDA 76]